MMDKILYIKVVAKFQHFVATFPVLNFVYFEETKI